MAEQVGALLPFPQLGAQAGGFLCPGLTPGLGEVSVNSLGSLAGPLCAWCHGGRPLSWGFLGQEAGALVQGWRGLEWGAEAGLRLPISVKEGARQAFCTPEGLKSPLGFLGLLFQHTRSKGKGQDSDGLFARGATFHPPGNPGEVMMPCLSSERT